MEMKVEARKEKCVCLSCLSIVCRVLQDPGFVLAMKEAYQDMLECQYRRLH